MVNHARAVKYCLLEIHRAAKTLSEAGQERMKAGYEKLLTLTGGVVRQAKNVVEQWERKKLKIAGRRKSVEKQIGQLRHFLPLVEKVIEQTRERLWQGNCRVPGKVLSLFETHTQVIRKGKVHRPNEFGRLADRRGGEWNRERL